MDITGSGAVAVAGASPDPDTLAGGVTDAQPDTDTEADTETGARSESAEPTDHCDPGETLPAHSVLASASASAFAPLPMEGELCWRAFRDDTCLRDGRDIRFCGRAE